MMCDDVLGTQPLFACSSCLLSLGLYDLARDIEIVDLIRYWM